MHVGWPAIALLALLVLLPLDAHAQGGRGRGGGSGGRILVDEGPDQVGGFPLSRSDVHALFDSGRDVRPALPAYETAMAEAERRGHMPTAVRAGSAAVLIANKLGLAQKVLTLAPRVIALGRGSSAPTPEIIRSVLETSATLSNVYRKINDDSNARRILIEAREFAGTPAAAQYRESVIIAIGTISRALSEMDLDAGDHTGALANAQDYVRIADENVRRNHGQPGPNRNVARAALQLGRVLHAMRRLDEAADTLRRATPYARAAGFPDLIADVAINGAELALDRRDPRAALQVAVAGRGEAERAGLGPHVGNLDRLIATAHAALGDFPAALVAIRSAMDHVERTRAGLSDTTTRAGLLERGQSLYASAVDLALRAQRPADAFEIAERARSRAFLDLLGSATLSKGRTQTLVQEEVALRARLAEASAAAGGGDDDRGAGHARARVEAVERDYKAFLERVRKENGEQASLMTVEPVSLAEIQTLLPPTTVLVEYLVTSDELVTWVIDKATVQVRRTPMKREALVADVRDFRTAIADRAPLADVEKRAAALYAILVGPSHQSLTGKRLLIVPHDVLHYLPFAALRTPAARWLTEEHAMATVPSASVLKFLVGKGASAGDRVLAVGNPDLGPGLALRYAEYEIRAILERFPTTTTALTRAAATESRVKREITTAGIIHFAVHGELNAEDPMKSALLLVPGDGEDGLLEVRELFATELNARLVVLAACESGLGKLSRGDELVGLQRAFLYAGTPAVMTTLWKVDDRASFTLMRAFYDGLEANGATESLRAAQRALLRTSPHPFAWAAYGVTGAPR